MFSDHNCAYFTEPTLLKLALYLREVKDWEEFGMCLLPKDDIHILEVNYCYRFDIRGEYLCIFNIYIIILTMNYKSPSVSVLINFPSVSNQ